jgi:hypothetical protein
MMSEIFPLPGFPKKHLHKADFVLEIISATKA